MVSMDNDSSGIISCRWGGRGFCLLRLRRSNALGWGKHFHRADRFGSVCEIKPVLDSASSLREGIRHLFDFFWRKNPMPQIKASELEFMTGSFTQRKSPSAVISKSNTCLGLRLDTVLVLRENAPFSRKRDAIMVPSQIIQIVFRGDSANNGEHAVVTDHW